MVNVPRALPTAQTITPRRNRRRYLNGRARAAIVSALVLFVVSQAALRIWINSAKPEYRDPVFEPRYRLLQKQRAEKSAQAATIVFLGSSMTFHGIQAGAVDDKLTTALARPIVSVNLGTSGNGPIAQLMYLKKLLRRGIQPDLLVLEINPPLFIDSSPGDLPRLPAECLEWEDIDVLKHFGGGKSFRKRWIENYLVPVYGHRLAILSQEARVLVPYTELWAPHDKVDDHGYRPFSEADVRGGDQEVERNRAICRPLLQAFHLAGERVRAVEEFADIASKNHIPILLVHMPERPSVRALYGAGINELFSESHRIAAAHGLAEVNAFDWMAEESFADNLHLNDAGAACFTQLLIDRAILPLMKESAHNETPRSGSGEKSLTLGGKTRNAG